MNILVILIKTKYKNCLNELKMYQSLITVEHYSVRHSCTRDNSTIMLNVNSNKILRGRETLLHDKVCLWYTVTYMCITYFFE